MCDFSRKVRMVVRDNFPPKSDIAEVVNFVKSQKVPGQLIVSLPGNGGVTAITFVGKEVEHRGEIAEIP